MKTLWSLLFSCVAVGAGYAQTVHFVLPSQGVSVSILSQSGATNGQVLTWSSERNAWIATNIVGSGLGDVTQAQLDNTNIALRFYADSQIATAIGPLLRTDSVGTAAYSNSATFQPALGFTPLTNSATAITNALGYQPATNGLSGSTNLWQLRDKDTGAIPLSVDTNDTVHVDSPLMVTGNVINTAVSNYWGSGTRNTMEQLDVAINPSITNFGKILVGHVTALLYNTNTLHVGTGSGTTMIDSRDLVTSNATFSGKTIISNATANALVSAAADKSLTNVVIGSGLSYDTATRTLTATAAGVTISDLQSATNLISTADRAYSDAAKQAATNGLWSAVDSRVSGATNVVWPASQIPALAYLATTATNQFATDIKSFATTAKQDATNALWSAVDARITGATNGTFSSLQFQVLTNAVNTGMIPWGKTTFTNLSGNITLLCDLPTDFYHHLYSTVVLTNGTATDYKATFLAVSLATNSWVLGQDVWVTNKSKVIVALSYVFGDTNGVAARFPQR